MTDIATKPTLKVWQEREDEHRETLQRLQAQIEARQTELGGLNRALQERAALAEEVETYEKLLEELRSRFAESKQCLAGMHEQIAQREENLEELETRAKVERRRAEEAADEVQHLRQSQDFLTKRTADLRGEEAKLNEEVGRQLMQIENQKDALRSVEETLSARKSELNFMGMRLTEKEEMLRQRDERIKAQELQIKERDAELHALDRKSEDMRRHLINMESRLAEMEAHIARLQAREQELLAKNEALRGGLSKIQVDIGEKTAEMINILGEKDRLVKEIRELGDARNKAAAAHDLRQQQLVEIEQQIANRRDDEINLRIQLEDLMQKIAQHEVLEAKRRDSIAKLDEQIRYYENKIASLRESNIEMEMRQKSIRDDMQRVTEQVATHKEESANLSDRIGVLRSQIAESTDERLALSDQIAGLVELEQKLKTQLSLLSQKEEIASSQLVEREGMLKAVGTEIQRTELELNSKRRECETTESRVRDMRLEENHILAEKSKQETILGGIKEKICAAEKTLSDFARLADGERSRLAQEKQRADSAAEIAERNKARMEDIGRQIEEVLKGRDEAQVSLLKLRNQALEKTEELAELEALRQDKLSRLDALQNEISLIKKERERQEDLLRQVQTHSFHSNLRNLKETLIRTEQGGGELLPAEKLPKVV